MNQKYYVYSGEFNAIVMADSARFAALTAIERFHPKNMGREDVFVSKKGFSSCPDFVFPKKELLLEIFNELHPESE